MDSMELERQRGITIQVIHRAIITICYLLHLVCSYLYNME